MNLHEQLITWDNLWSAYHFAARGKRGRSTTASFELYLADHLLDLQRELTDQSYQPGEYNSFYIHEPKRRLISAAPFRDRVVHHALCNLTTPFFERRFIAECFANRTGKGTHRAIDCCQRFSRRFQYVLQCDIVQFFPSVDQQILRVELLKNLPDDSLVWLIDRILESGRGVLAENYQMVYFPGDDILAPLRPRGLPIGNLTSQWWANVYLNGLDHFVKRELGCRAYVRYVDDFLLFSDRKVDLWKWRELLVDRLSRLRLTLHESSAQPYPVQHGIPFLGFTIFPDHRLLKRRKGIAFQRKLKQAIKQRSASDVSASIRGWINHVRYGDTYGLRRAVLGNCGLLAEDQNA
jgi:RNA-directed DNA polymerase